MKIRGTKKRTMEQITMMARWFNVLRAMGTSAKKAAFYIGFVYGQSVSQTTLLRYVDIAEKQAIKDAN